MLQRDKQTSQFGKKKMSGEGRGQMQNKIFLRGCLWLFIMQTGQFWLRLVKENIRPITICQLSFYLVHASSHAAPKNRHMSNTDSTDTLKKRCVLMWSITAPPHLTNRGSYSQYKMEWGKNPLRWGSLGGRGERLSVKDSVLNLWGLIGHYLPQRPCNTNTHTQHTDTQRKMA